jgi:hypothetical protein
MMASKLPAAISLQDVRRMWRAILASASPLSLLRHLRTTATAFATDTSRSCSAAERPVTDESASLGTARDLDGSHNVFAECATRSPTFGANTITLF